jgi:porin
LRECQVNRATGRFLIVVEVAQRLCLATVKKHPSSLRVVVALTAVFCTAVTNPLFPACPCNTVVPDAKDAEQVKPRFDNENYLAGDWFGLRNTLYDYGIEITAGYTTEPAGNPIGGPEHGFTYLHNFGFGIQLDLDKILCIPDATFLITISQRSGRGLTQDDIGNAISVQQIFGGGETYRLVQMRWDQRLFDDRLEFSFGRLTTTADFFSSPFYCQFVNNGICGQPTAPFFNMPNGITAYPAGYWGGLVQVRPTKETYAKVGVYDGDPSHGDDRHGLNFGFGNNGVLVVSEVGYKSNTGVLGMPCRYSFAGYYHTGDFPDVAEDAFMTNLFVSGRPGRPHSGQYGLYLLFEQMLLRNAGRDTGLNSFVTFVVSPDEDKSVMPYFVNGGLIWEGLIPCRPHDKLDLGFYSGVFSQSLRDAQHAAGLPGQTSETDIELNYQVQLTPYLYLRPNIQYVFKPNGLNTIRNALVLGTEIGITF